MQADDEEIHSAEELELEGSERPAEHGASTADYSEDDDHHRRQKKRRAEDMEPDAENTEREREVKRPNRGGGEVLFRILCPNVRMGSVLGKVRGATSAGSCSQKLGCFGVRASFYECFCSTSAHVIVFAGGEEAKNFRSMTLPRVARLSRSLEQPPGRKSRRASPIQALTFA